MPRVHRRTRKHVVGLVCAALLGSGLAVMTTMATAPGAQAHGNVNDPIARGYRCLEVWGDVFWGDTYKDADPMCWNAFHTNPNAMWNWNGMLIDGLAGNYTSVTDICSANSAQYGVLSVPGDWKATDKPAKFTLNLVDQASHGADWIKVYISKDGFDPTKERLGWDDLSPVIGETGRIPTSGNGIVDPKVGGSAYAVPVDATGYSGRRVLFTHWKASHADQTYYLCSDVNIGGTGNQTTTTTTRPTTTTTTTTGSTTTTTTTTRPTTTTTTTTTTSQNNGGACSASYTTVSSWPGGFQGEVKVSAGSSAVNKWTLTWSTPSGVSITQGWNATLSSSGSTVTATNVAYNGTIGAGGSTTFGFLGSGNPSGWSPSITCSTA